MKATVRLSQFNQQKEDRQRKALEAAGLTVIFLERENVVRHNHRAGIYEVTFPEDTITDTTRMEASPTLCVVYTTPAGLHFILTNPENVDVGLLLPASNELFDAAFQYEGCDLPRSHWERRPPA